MSVLARTFAQAGTNVQPAVLAFQRGMKRNAKIPVTMLKALPQLGTEGATVYVNRAYMRYELYPKRLAEYVVSRKGPIDKRKIKGEEEQNRIGQIAAQTNVQEKVHQLAVRNQETIAKITRINGIIFERKVVAATEATKEADEGVVGGDKTQQAIYGSLTKSDVLIVLEEQYGITVDKEALLMDDKIKSTGDYTCVVKLIYAGQASFKAKVIPTKENVSEL